MQSKIKWLSLLVIPFLFISCGGSGPDPNEGAQATPGAPVTDDGLDTPGADVAGDVEPDNAAIAEINDQAVGNCPSEVTDKSGYNKCLYGILKNRQPAVRSQNVVTCTKGEDSQNYVVTTYNVNPGAGLRCDVVRESDGAMLIFARNDRGFCQRSWHGRLGCEGPKPPEPAPVQQEGGSSDQQAASVSSIENAVENRRLSITSGELNFTLASGGCVNVPNSVSWDSIEVKVNNLNLGCQESNPGEKSSCYAGHYKAEVVGRIARRFLPDRDAYGLVKQAQAPARECASWPSAEAADEN